MNHAFSVKKGNQLLYDRLVREHDAATAMVERPELRMTNSTRRGSLNVCRGDANAKTARGGRVAEM